MQRLPGPRLDKPWQDPSLAASSWSCCPAFGLRWDLGAEIRVWKKSQEGPVLQVGTVFSCGWRM